MKYKILEGLSIRAMSAIGVSCFKKYCRREAIWNADINLFCDHLLELLIADNISDWDEEFKKLNITGLGDVLPIEIKEKYPVHFDTIDLISQNIREISAFQIYGAWKPEASYKFLFNVADLCDVSLEKEFMLECYKKHSHENGWGKPINIELREKWNRDNNL